MTEGRDSKREQRTAELIAREAANFIREYAGTESLITVTRALPAGKSDTLTVFVSVFPEEREASAIRFLARQREPFSDYLKGRTRIKPLPRVDFELDAGEKHRRRLEELGKES